MPDYTDGVKATFVRFKDGESVEEIELDEVAGDHPKGGEEGVLVLRNADASIEVSIGFPRLEAYVQLNEDC